MRITSNGIDIHLEQDEIVDLWNVIMFALDLQEQREKNNEACMYEKEKQLAINLVDTLNRVK